jgi:hypothetical protein
MENNNYSRTVKRCAHRSGHRPSHASRLLEYLEAVRDLREQPVRDIAEYRDKRWWADDIPDHPACAVTTTGAATAAGVEPWLRVSKAHVKSPPSVPDERGWRDMKLARHET